MKEYVVYNTMGDWVRKMASIEPNPETEPDHYIFAFSDKRLYQPEKWSELLEELKF